MTRDRGLRAGGPTPIGAALRRSAALGAAKVSRAMATNTDDAPAGLPSPAIA
jgi:hypothetical protein